MERAESADRTSLHALAMQKLDELRDIPVKPEHRDRLNAILDSMETLTSAILESNSQWEQWGLSPFQARLADCLYARMPQTVSHAALCNAVYFDRAPGNVPEPKTMVVNVYHLRNKLLEHKSPFIIENVWGFGYRMIRVEKDNGFASPVFGRTG
jgi:DNA-binding winged helix-turn-helix (wHTH) protein